MYFEYKRPKHAHGDFRVIQRFAIFPRVLQDEYYKNLGVIWLGKYDLVQKFYPTVGWVDECATVLGTGIVIARYKVQLYSGRLINKEEEI